MMNLGRIFAKIRELNWFKNSTVLYTEFKQQFTDDTCSSSAAAIACKFAKMDHSNSFSRVVTVNPKLLSGLRDDLHATTDQPSEPIIPLRLTKPELNCPKCGIRFSKKVALSSHVRLCNT